MKKILFLLMMMMPTFAFSQNANKGDTYLVYCVAYNHSNKIELLDNKKSKTLCSKDGKELEFETEAQLLSYLGRRGWRLVSVTRMDSANLNHFYLEKEVTSDEQAKEGLFFKEDRKK